MDRLFALFFELFWWWVESSLFLHSPAAFCVAWLLTCYALWDRYIVVMGLYRAHLRKQLHGLNKVLAIPSVVVGVFLDVLVNLTVASVVFRAWPREWLVTDRLQRYLKDEYHSQRWRGRRADWWCTNVLHPIDDDHCL